MNYCVINNVKCECANSYGWCMVTACKRYSGIINGQPMISNNNVMYFPFKIGSITFRNKKELIDWASMQQDEDYGMGNNA